MAFVERPCPECGEVLPVNRLRFHRRDAHEVPLAQPKRREQTDDVTDDVVRDTPPKPRRGGKAPAAVGMNVEAQLRLIYDLVGTLTASRTPMLSGAIKRQAGACAKADEQLLRRWPKLYAAMEKGLIAGDILAVFMAHYPILMAAREEIEARRLEAAIREGTVLGGFQEQAA